MRHVGIFTKANLSMIFANELPVNDLEIFDYLCSSPDEGFSKNECVFVLMM